MEAQQISAKMDIGSIRDPGMKQELASLGTMDREGGEGL